MDKIVSVSNGVIVGSGENYITVRLLCDAIIDFPDYLFPKHIRCYGQPITYEIWERPNGTLYQIFSARVDKQKNIYLDDVKDLLNKIKLRETL